MATLIVVQSQNAVKPIRLEYQVSNSIRRSVNPKRWARKHLQRGDLTALSGIHEHEVADHGKIDRLTQRGFIVGKAGGSFRPTVKGRIALWIDKRGGQVGPYLMGLGIMGALFYWFILE